MTTSFKIANLRDFLREKSFDCTLEPSGEAFPFPRIMLFLGSDHQERERILEITIKEQLPKKSENEESSKYYLLEYMLKFAFKVETHAIVEMGRYIAFINRNSDFPGFEMDEVTGHLYFRSNHLGNRELTDYELMRAQIGIIQLQIDLFQKQIEDVAQSKITFNEVIEEGFKAIEELNKKS